jgi:hypothetical protein
MALSLKVHHFERRQGATILAKVTPYVRVSDAAYGAVFLQNGNAYGEGGPVIKPFPAWVFPHLETMSKKIRAEIGFTDDRIDFLKKGGKVEEPDLEVVPVDDTPPPPGEPPGFMHRTLTSEEAEARSFADLKTYAAQFDISSNGKENLIEKLKAEGYIV